MPLTLQNSSGDGINDVRLDTIVVLPDSGSSVVVGGYIQSIYKAQVPVIGGPLTAPAVPGSGSTFWNIQVDANTGTATVQTSTVGDPAPILSADGVTPQVIIFRQTLTFGVSATALDSDTSSTPDQPV